MDRVRGETRENEKELVGEEVSEGDAGGCWGAGAGVDVRGGVNPASNLVSGLGSADVAGSEACRVGRVLLKSRGPVRGSR